MWRSHVPALGFIRVSDTGGLVTVAVATEFCRCDFGESEFSVNKATGHVVGTQARIKDIEDVRLTAYGGDVSYSASFTPGTLTVTAKHQPSGQRRWRRTLQMQDVEHPRERSAGSGVLIVGYLNLSGFLVLDSSTGMTLWTSKAPLTRAVPGGDDNRVYVASPGVAQAVDSHTGIPRWRADARPRESSGHLVAAVASNAAVVAIEQGDRLGVYDHNGHLRYTTKLSNSSNMSLFVGQDRLHVGLVGTSGSRCD